MLIFNILGLFHNFEEQRYTIKSEKQEQGLSPPFFLSYFFPKDPLVQIKTHRHENEILHNTGSKKPFFPH